MYITLWDLDYYYAEKKVNCFNPDVMKISSYHKQNGDIVNFVTSEDDINRFYDVCYIIKEKDKTPNPPMRFYMDSKVKWWGKAYRSRINWKMTDVMLAVRPDYLLYPEKQTKLERAEQIRLLNNKGDLLPLVQDWTNGFKNKRTIVTDHALWTTKTEIIELALKKLLTVKNVTFLEPIWLQKLASNKTIRDLFCQLNLTAGCDIKWVPVNMIEYWTLKETIVELKEKLPHIKIGSLVLKIYYQEEWQNIDIAKKHFAEAKRIILDAKKNKIAVEFRGPRHRLDTPYFELFENLETWTKECFELSWLEFITKKYGNGLRFNDNLMFWARPKEWNEVFRNLLRQTYIDADFLKSRWGEKSMSDNEIPWELWKKEFEYGI